MSKITVTPEGREGVYLADRTSLKAWIEDRQFEQIHNFIPGGGMILGADHEVSSVLQDIDQANRVGILTGAAQRGNLNHALALILPDGPLPLDERLEMYDIGTVTEDDLSIVTEEALRGES